MPDTPDDILRNVQVVERLIALRKAREHLLDFVRLTMPDPEDLNDIRRSRYEAARHHEVIAAALEEVEAGRMPRLIITMPPRHGKSELASRKFPAWFWGKDPYRQVLFATYNSDFAKTFGKHVRTLMESPQFQQVFPLCKLKTGSKAADAMTTEDGGEASFVGVGGGLTGKGADLLIIDDPIKEPEEAASKSFRDKQWTWFSQAAMTRLMPMGRVVIIMTRWHEDDLVGRLTDPTNPCYNSEEAASWKVLSLPAIAVDDDPMGRKPGEALWPDRFPIPVLEAQKRLDPAGFSALYQGSPTPADGDYFKEEWLATYTREELDQVMAEGLRIYGASDHAVATTQSADKTCLGCVGVDQHDNVWVLPDLFWQRARTDFVCEAMLDNIKRNKPIWWKAERGHISKAIGPFLRKRMQERAVYCPIEEVVPAKDKETRAQAIRARMAMGKVKFPRYMGWWQDAKAELLKFPRGRHDDFVDFLAHIGMGLATQVGASPEPELPKGPKTGTLAWVKASSKRKEDRENRLKSYWT